jgi:pimeloyl-ACP methyl ester carboxylesterase
VIAEPVKLRPTEMLRPLGLAEIEIAPGLRHAEVFTMRGLLGVMWHGPFDAERIVVTCPGAMGGLLGPGRGMFHQLGMRLSAKGIATIRVDYRRPNDLESCVLDTVSAIDLAAQRGASKVITVGHSFGGAVAVNVGAVLPQAVAGVCTLSTQSAGCEIAHRLAPRPLLLIHGSDDELLPPHTSEVVNQLAGGHGDVIIVPGEGHILADDSGAILDRVVSWVRETFGAADEHA